MFSTVPINKVVEHYGGRVRENYMGWQKIKCPFHSDSHASAGVNITDNIFVCHGCGIKGNGFNIIKLHEGVTYREAIKIAETITGESYKLLRGQSAVGRRVSSQTRNNSRSSTSNSIRSRR